MSSDCAICLTSCDGKEEKFFHCDSCQRPIHVDCSDLSASEVRCLELKKRILKFFCNDCQEGLKILPKVLNQLSKLQEDVKKINDTISSQKLSDSPSKICQQSEILEEVADRAVRKNNIILYNVEESSAKSPADIKKHDTNIVMEALNSIQKIDSDTELRLFRLGKPRSDGSSRPIKIIFGDPELALSFLKNKKHLKGPIRMNADLTLMQRNHLKELRSQLEILNKDAVLKTIKYINGQPRIVDIKNNKRGPKN